MDWNDFCAFDARTGGQNDFDDKTEINRRMAVERAEKEHSFKRLREEHRKLTRRMKRQRRRLRKQANNKDKIEDLNWLFEISLKIAQRKAKKEMTVEMEDLAWLFQ